MSMPSDHWISELIRTIQECRAENNDQRFGQLLYNLIATNDIRKDGFADDNWQENFHERLFYIRNEELVQILKDYKDKKL